MGWILGGESRKNETKVERFFFSFLSLDLIHSQSKRKRKRKVLVRCWLKGQIYSRYKE